MSADWQRPKFVASLQSLPHIEATAHAQETWLWGLFGGQNVQSEFKLSKLPSPVQCPGNSHFQAETRTLTWSILSASHYPSFTIINPELMLKIESQIPSCLLNQNRHDWIHIWSFQGDFFLIQYSFEFPSAWKMIVNDRSWICSPEDWLQTHILVISFGYALSSRWWVHWTGTLYNLDVPTSTRQEVELCVENQLFSTFLMLWHCNTAPQVDHKISPLLAHYCNFAVTNCHGNICYAG